MKKAKAVLCVIFMAIAMIVAFRKVAFSLEAKGAYNKNGDFFRVADECDVLFLGTSHVTMAVYPMELWHDYGITSYNISGYGHLMPMNYWTLMCALDYAQPDVVVVDCFALESDKVVKEDGKFVHFSLDSIPLSKMKMRAVCDMFDNFETRTEYLWDFSLYHDRWDELNRDDFEVDYGKTRGATFEIGICEPDAFVLQDVEWKPIDSVGVEYLRKIVEECQSRGIKAVFTFLPFPAQEDQQKIAAYAGEIAEEYGVEYLNFLQIDLVDYQTDCFDSYSHLNVSGGHKITSFLGKYLTENCGVVDHRQDGLVNWDEDYDAYQRYKIDRMQAQESLQNYLVMMADKNFSLCLFVDGKSKLWDYEQYVGQIRNLAPGYSFPSFEKIMGEKADYLLVLDNGKGEITDFYGEEGGEVETSFGKVTYTRTDSGEKALYLGDSEESFLMEQDRDGRELTVQVVLIDNQTGSVVDVERFDEELKVNK